MNCTRTLLVTALLVASFGCSPRLRTAEEWFVAAHSSGGPGPIVSGVVVYTDGLIELDDGGPVRRWSSLRQSELTALRELVRSGPWQQGLAFVEAKGPHWSCCDRETIAISFYGAGQYSIPLTDVRPIPGSSEVLEIPAVPPSLHPGLALFDKILRRHFGPHWRGWGATFGSTGGAT